MTRPALVFLALVPACLHPTTDLDTNGDHSTTSNSERLYSFEDPRMPHLPLVATPEFSSSLGFLKG